jgi:hypothetical protein
MAQRFGTRSAEEVNSFVKEFGENPNTQRGIEQVQRLFQDFCKEKSIDYEPSTITDDEINSLLQNFIVNVRRKDGTDYKERVIKGLFNSLASNIIMKDVKRDQNRVISIFTDPSFEGARKARSAKRKELQKDPTRRTVNAAAIPQDDKMKMMQLYTDDTPDGLNRRYYQYASFIFQWRGGEGANSSIYHYKEEKDLRGVPTGRIEYNPIFSKTCQGGDKRLSDSKFIEDTGEVHKEAARLYRLIISKRPPNCRDDRFFMSPNVNWKLSSKWYNTVPIGCNNIGKWTKEAAAAVGIDVISNRIVNQSERSTAISLGAEAGVQPAQQIRMSGHNNPESLKSYTDMPPGWRGKMSDKMLGFPEKKELTDEKKEFTSEKKEKEEVSNEVPAKPPQRPMISSLISPVKKRSYCLRDDPYLHEEFQKRPFIDFLQKPCPPGFSIHGSTSFSNCVFRFAHPQDLGVVPLPSLEPPKKKSKLSVTFQSQQ